MKIPALRAKAWFPANPEKKHFPYWNIFFLLLLASHSSLLAVFIVTWRTERPAMVALVPQLPSTRPPSWNTLLLRWVDEFHYRWILSGSHRSWGASRQRGKRAILFFSRLLLSTFFAFVLGPRLGDRLCYFHWWFSIFQYFSRDFPNIQPKACSIFLLTNFVSNPRPLDR